MEILKNKDIISVVRQEKLINSRNKRVIAKLRHEEDAKCRLDTLTIHFWGSLTLQLEIQSVYSQSY